MSGPDPAGDLATVRAEVEAYDPELAKRPGLVAANKMDLPGASENVAKLSKGVAKEIGEVYSLSALTGEGVLEFTEAVARKINLGSQET